MLRGDEVSVVMLPMHMCLPRPQKSYAEARTPRVAGLAEMRCSGGDYGQMMK